MEEMKAILQERATEIRNRCGDGYEQDLCGKPRQRNGMGGDPPQGRTTLQTIRLKAVKGYRVTILNYLLLALPVDVALESPNPHQILCSFEKRAVVNLITPTARPSLFSPMPLHFARQHLMILSKTQLGHG